MRRLDTILVLASLVAIVGLGAGMVASAPPRPRPTAAAPTAPQTPAPREVVEGVVGPVLTLDPLYAVTPGERSIAALLFRGLTRPGPDGAILPDLATSWSVSDGGSTWTFRLAPDMRWHDRVHVTADDVVATVATLTDDAYAGPVARRWAGVAVERIDRFTVRFRLPLPLVGFLPLTMQPLIPAHLLGVEPVAERPGLPFGPEPVGSGPFRLVRLDDDAVVLERVGPPPGGVPSTFAPGPLAPVPEPTPARAGATRMWIETYRFEVHPDAAAVAGAFVAGGLDGAAGLDPQQMELVAAATGARAVRYPSGRLVALLPNLRFAAGPLFDPAIRRALSGAIDRRRIVATVFGDAATPVGGPVPPTFSGFDPATSGPPDPDPTAARDALLAAGWTEMGGSWRMPGAEEPTRIEILVRDTQADPTGAAIARAVADDWRALGLTVDVAALPPDRLVAERIRPGTFDVVLTEVEVGLEPDLYPLLVSSQAAVGGTNVIGYQSTIMDRLLDDARRAADAATRIRRWQALQATLAREMPILPLVFPDQVFLVGPRLTGPARAPVDGPEGRYWDVLAWRLATGPDE